MSKAQWDSFVSPATGRQMLRLRGKGGYFGIAPCPLDWAARAFEQAVDALADAYLAHIDARYARVAGRVRGAERSAGGGRS